MGRLGIVLSMMIASGSPVRAADWHLQIISLNERVTRVEIEPGDDPWLERLRLGSASAKWYALTKSANGEIAFSLADPWTEQYAVSDAADGTIGATGEHNISAVFYAEPTSRLAVARNYNPPTFGTLSVLDRANAKQNFHADPESAFTGHGPLLADLDGDGNDEIIATETGASGGRLAVFRLTLAGIERLALTPAPAGPTDDIDLLGVADIDGDGRLDILTGTSSVYDGRLEVWTYANRELGLAWPVRGITTIAAGGTLRGLAAIADFDGDQVPDVLVPGRDARSIRLLTFRDRSLAEPLLLPLPAAISSNLLVVPAGDSADGPVIVFGLADASLAIMSSAAPKPAPGAAEAVAP